MDAKEKISVIQELAYELKVGEVMKKEVITVSPNNLIADLREILRDNRISGTPVVDKGKLVGIISLEDFIKCLLDGEMEIPVSQKMTQSIQTLYEDEPLIHAINKFEKLNYGRFPVVARENGKLVGIITKGDIIHGLLQRLENEYYEEEIKRLRASHFFEDIIADESRIILQYNIVGNDFKRAGESSSRLKKTLTRLGIRPQVIRRLTIASYEAEMNIVIFTSQGKIITNIQPSQIKLSAIDSGPGIPDVEQAMQPGFSTAPDWIREMGFGAGMGLANIKKCADEFSINSKVGQGTQIEIIINLE
ncbi:MAG: CBS domain-containing protein [bacterium]